MIAPGAVTTGKLANGAVTNAKLANPSLTVTAGTGLTGGGPISLGGSGSLGVDPTIVQQWVSGTCGSRSAISSINQNGSVGCVLPFAVDTGQTLVFDFTFGTTGPGTVTPFVATPDGRVIDAVYPVHIAGPLTAELGVVNPEFGAYEVGVQTSAPLGSASVTVGASRDASTTQLNIPISQTQDTTPFVYGPSGIP